MLAATATLLFFAMIITVIYGVGTFAKDQYGEMIFFAILIAGTCVLNALKFWKIVDGGLNPLSMGSGFQLTFYIYMSSLATIIPPSIFWLVFRRLTDNLRNMAARDPLASPPGFLRRGRSGGCLKASRFRALPGKSSWTQSDRVGRCLSKHSRRTQHVDASLMSRTVKRGAQEGADTFTRHFNPYDSASKRQYVRIIVLTA